MKRLAFLGSATVLGAAAMTENAWSQTLPAPSPAPKRTSQFFADDAMNFVLLNMLGQSAYGLGDVGRAFAMFDQIEDGNDASAYDVLTATGRSIVAQADAARSAGHRISARDLYFQASNYLYTAMYFCDGMGRPENMLPTFMASRDALDKAFTLVGYPVEHISIPYANTPMPGYFIKPDTSDKPRPLFVMVNGSDGSVLDMWAQGGKAAIERGYNVLIFDGPGQGAMLWLEHTTFRYDYEAAVTPVVDYALKRRDVDPHRMAIQGISQGGYWVPRALAFEHRFKAAIADPGVFDIGASFIKPLPAPVLAMLQGGQKQRFDAVFAQMSPKAKAAFTFRARPYGFTSTFDLYTSVQKYTLAGVLNNISTPLLITDPDNEQFFPGQPQQLFNALPEARKVRVPFTVAEGADRHCEPAAPLLRSQRVFDWLDDQLK